MPAGRRTRRGQRGQRGVVFPSPVVILSVVAVAAAALAFVFTQGSGSQDHEITTTSQQQTVAPSPTESASSKNSPSATGSPTHSAKPKPKLDRATTPVVVFNNSRVPGLAAQVEAKAHQIGWETVGADNWYGTIPSSTVYFPPQLKAAAQQLALDLGVGRTAPAVAPMSDDRLTLILTGPLT